MDGRRTLNRSSHTPLPTPTKHNQVAALAGSNPQGALEGVIHMLRALPEGQDKAALVAALKAAL